MEHNAKDFVIILETDTQTNKNVRSVQKVFIHVI